MSRRRQFEAIHTDYAGDRFAEPPVVKFVETVGEANFDFDPPSVTALTDSCAVRRRRPAYDARRSAPYRNGEATTTRVLGRR